MYVTGTICCLPSASGLVPQISPSCSQQSSTWSMFAMSAIEQPADRFGSVTVCSGVDRISAVSDGCQRGKHVVAGCMASVIRLIDAVIP